MLPLNLFLFAAIFVLIALAFRAWKDESPAPLGEPAFSRWIFWLLMLLAVAVRVYRFGELPYGINQDEAMSSVDALALGHHATSRFGTWMPVQLEGWGWTMQSVLLSYLMAPFVAIGGLTPVAVRLPSLLISLLGLVALYRLTSVALGRRIGLWVLFLAVINPWHIMQSRWSLDCNMFGHFLLFSLLFLQLGVTAQGWRRDGYLALSMVLFGVTMYAYGAAYYTIPPFLLAVGAWLLWKRILGGWRMAACAVIYLLVAWPIFVLVKINYFKDPTVHTFYCTIPMLSELTRIQDLLPFSEDGPLLRALKNSRWLTMVMFWTRPGGENWMNALPQIGPMYYFNAPFFLLGVWAAVRKLRQQSFGLILLLAWLGLGIYSGLMMNRVSVHRVHMVFYPMLVFSGLGIASTLALVRARWQPVWTRAVCAVYLTGFCAFCAIYFTQHATQAHMDYFPGFRESIKAAQQSGREMIRITARTQLGHRDGGIGNDQCSEILTLFHTQTDALEFQSGAFGKRYPRMIYQETKPAPVSNVAYVYRTDERQYFDPDAFTFEEYADFGVAISKK